jgi:hypothetical protein
MLLALYEMCPTANAVYLPLSPLIASKCTVDTLLTDFYKNSLNF